MRDAPGIPGQLLVEALWGPSYMKETDFSSASEGNEISSLYLIAS